MNRTGMSFKVVAALAAVAFFWALRESSFDRRNDRAFAEVAAVVSRQTWDTMQPIHRNMIRSIVRQSLENGRPTVAACWDQVPASQGVIDAFNAAITLGSSSGDFEQTNRWSALATPPGSFAQGSPATIRYSFVPDGTLIPSGTGEPAGNSNLFAWLNGIYGSPAVWQQIFADEFARYTLISGLAYVHETADDGVDMFSQGGVVGVRGDVRIGAKTIDGNSNVLAYNFFPNNGDMVLDSADSFYNTTTNNSRRLRNVIGHEHGHGLGMLHVCPTDNTKLMEPFINTGFLGPQHDELLNAQRHYGDFGEPNDSAATATDLGAYAVGNHVVAGRSIDDNSDTDWFKFSVAGSFTAAVTLSPVGQTYVTGPQTSACNTGSTFNSTTQHDLSVQLVDAGGVTVLNTANSAPAGAAEVLPATPLGGPGTYYVRVNPSTANSIQLYTLAINLQVFSPPAFDIAFPNGLPASIPDGATSDLDVQVTNQTGQPDPAQAFLFSRVDGAPFTSAPLADLGGGLFRGQLPAAACFADIDYYVSIAPLGGGAVLTSPIGAPIAFHSTEALGTVTTVFADDFQTNMGWTVTNDGALTDGAWNRGVPVGGGDRGDPATDGDGSGACYLTDNVDGNSDVDGGTTTLTSPAIDVSAYSNARISYLFWYDNDSGSNPGTDVFTIQISNNGVNWVTVESYNQSIDAWVAREILVADYVATSANVRMRFLASDPAPGAVVEAGVDGFVVEACLPPPVPGLGVCGVGQVGFFLGGPYDVLFVDGQTGGAPRIVPLTVGQSYTVSMNDVPGVYAAMPFAIFGTIGIPGPNDFFLVSPLIGAFCFTPCPAAVGNPNLFTLTNNVGPDPCGQIIPSTPTPWQLVVPAVPFGYQITLQPIVYAQGFYFVGNGVVADYTN